MFDLGGPAGLEAAGWQTGRPKPRVLAFGQSHLEALIAAHARGGGAGIAVDVVNFLDPRYNPPLQRTPDGDVYNPLIFDDLRRALAGEAPDFLLASIGGAEHFLRGAVCDPRRYDFILPDQPDLPLTQGAEIIPYDLVLAECVANTRARFRLIETVRGLSSLPVAHLSPPPPVASSAIIEAELPRDWRDDVAKYGVPSLWFRYRIWAAFMAAGRIAAAETGVIWLDTPAQSRDGNGFLRESYRRDGFHGNAAYGELVLAQLAAFAAGRVL